MLLAAAALSLLAGMETSGGLGEHTGATASVVYARGPVRVEAHGSTSDKYTGDGWRSGVWAEIRPGAHGEWYRSRLILGARATHRDGGAWSKYRAWVVIGSRLLTIIDRRNRWLRGAYIDGIIETAVNGENEESLGRLRTTIALGRMRFEATGLAEHHSAGWGWGMQYQVGAKF